MPRDPMSLVSRPTSKPMPAPITAPPWMARSWGAEGTGVVIWYYCEEKRGAKARWEAKCSWKSRERAIKREMVSDAESPQLPAPSRVVSVTADRRCSDARSAPEPPPSVRELVAQKRAEMTEQLRSAYTACLDAAADRALNALRAKNVPKLFFEAVAHGYLGTQVYHDPHLCAPTQHHENAIEAEIKRQFAEQRLYYDSDDGSGSLYQVSFQGGTVLVVPKLAILIDGVPVGYRRSRFVCATLDEIEAIVTPSSSPRTCWEGR